MNQGLQKVLAEKGYAPDRPRARASPLVTSQQQITRALTELPKGRVSRTESDRAFGSWWSLGSYEDRDRLAVIADCRRACIEDADAGGALGDLVALAIPPLPDGTPGIRVEFEGGTRAVQQAEREITSLLDRLHLPLHELAANGVREVYQAGGSGLEWYPNRSRTGVQGVEIIPAEELTPGRRDNERWWNQQNNPTPLSPQTFVFSAYGTRRRDEFGTPAMISALMELERKANITLGIDKVIRLLAQGAFLKIGIPEITPSMLGFQSDTDPDFIAARAEAYRAYVEVAASARDLGIGAFENGTEMDAIPLTGNVGGLSDLEEMNSLKVWSGLLTLPFMRGRMDSTTQALAQVVYPILMTHAMGVRQPVVRSIEFGLNLHLRLAGIAARATLAFQEPSNPFIEAHAKAANLQAQTDEKYLSLYGEEYLRYMAVRDGFDPDKAVKAWQAARSGPQPTPTTTPPPGGETNASDTQNEQP